MIVTINNDDTIPDEYPYYWFPEHSMPIEEWSKKYKPSMVHNNDGTKPWLWVRNSNPSRPQGNISGAVEEATQLLNEVTQRVKVINEDETIPVRANKKAAKKSKKQIRDEVLAEYTQKLKDVHIRHSYKTGKWLSFVPPDAVDTVWSRLAISIESGPLSKTMVDLAKVATTPPNESSMQRVICVYMHDIFDKEKVLEVMRILLQYHGLNLSGVKSDLYTKIGLDSKHPSHLQSTIWKNTDFLKDSDIKELREEFFTKLKADQAAKTSTDENKVEVPKPKPAAVDDDPFASEEEDSPELSTKKRPAVDDKMVVKKSKPNH